MKTKTKIILTVILLVIIGGGAAWYFTRTPEAAFETERATREIVARTVSVTGELVPADYVDLSFPKVGTVTEVLVEEGEIVTAGQALVTLDSSTLRAQLEAANIALDIAVANEDLARRGRTKDWDDLAPEEREAIKLASEQARQSVRTVLTQLADNTLVSPIDGNVSRVDIREGETAIAGSPIVRVSSPSGTFELESRIPEADITDLHSGMTGSVTFDSLPSDDVFPATMTGSDIAATVVQDVVSYVATFALDRDDDRLREGMSATIDIETARAENVVAVPFRAIIREDDRTYVEIPTGPATFERREVEIGIEGDDGLIEVKHGLSEGEEVIVSRKK